MQGGGFCKILIPVRKHQEPPYSGFFMLRYKYLSVITGFFTATLLLSNMLAGKIFAVGGMTSPASVIMFPISYVFGDILTEVYGYSASRRVVWTGFVTLIAAAFFIEIAKALPPAPFWHGQHAFEAVFSQTPRIVAGSIIAYFAGEFMNSYVLARMKVATGGKGMAARFIASTVVGVFVDTAIFCAIAFFGTMSMSALVFLIFCDWVAKVLWEVFALPVSLPLTSWMKKAENEDHYDRGTNFNPFVLGK